MSGWEILWIGFSLVEAGLLITAYVCGPRYNDVVLLSPTLSTPLIPNFQGSRRQGSGKAWRCYLEAPTNFQDLSIKSHEDTKTRDGPPSQV